MVHIHAEGPAFFAWLPKMFGKRVVVTVHGIDWQREKWQSGLGSKFIHQGEKNAAKYADEVIVLSKGVQNYFKETYGRETHFRDATATATARNIPTIRHILQHSRWSSRWFGVLCDDEGMKASVKLAEIVIYWEQ